MRRDCVQACAQGKSRTRCRAVSTVLYLPWKWKARCDMHSCCFPSDEPLLFHHPISIHLSPPHSSSLLHTSHSCPPCNKPMISHPSPFALVPSPRECSLRLPIAILCCPFTSPSTSPSNLTTSLSNGRALQRRAKSRPSQLRSKTFTTRRSFLADLSANDARNIGFAHGCRSPGPSFIFSSIAPSLGVHDLFLLRSHLKTSSA